jgi:hypothetical protein
MQNLKSEEEINNIKNINDKLFNSLLKNTELFNNIIFIYTPPKVGSTTLVSSIRLCASNKYSVIHIHDEIMLKYITGTHDDITINDLIYYNKSLGKNIYVIDVYRTPIERKMSEYFEKISCYHFNNSEENINNYNLDLIIKRFNCLFPFLGKGDHYYEKYNIEPDNFDFNQKYIHQNINGINYIKLRLNDSNEWGSILSKILNTNIYILTDYQTDKKTIGNLYDRFKNSYKLPMNYYELIKTDKYFNIYLNENEKNEYLSKWNNKLTDNFTSYTQEQYDFYVNLCLENQIYNDFQSEHYIDNGCLCVLCFKKREFIFNKVKNREIINDRIIHNEIVNEVKKNKIEKITNFAKKLTDIKNKITNKKINKLSQNVSNYNVRPNNNHKQKLGNIKYI